MKSVNRGTSRVTIRRFEPGDRAAFLSLYETVFDRDRRPDWFRWKYQENPYVDHVPIVVAERNSDLVGCRSLFAQEMRGYGQVWTAFQPCDTMVHPEHRRQGLFGRMNERTLERYADDGPSFFFNFPNEASIQGNLDHGWHEIGTVPLYYRFQDPVRALERWTGTGDSEQAEASSESRTAAALSRSLSNAISGSHRTGDRLLAPDADVRLERYETPPVETLERIYRRSIPDGIHTNRTAEFYRWRFANPARGYTAYVAKRGTEPVAALVVSTVGDHVRIVETVPRAVESERAALNRLLVAVLSEYENRSFVTAFGETLPTPVRYRFYPDTRPPLSTVVRPSARTLLARDLRAESAVENSSVADWTFSRLDLDTT
ncbi:GNAT family N-acetyltransferase [Natronococcus pandeyae]|uniref:GNAT family N-acetyltransferase n=1 Tax=Natronococcus pandeyae TaxID=2055836 RepID=A0A8J8Q2U8_9EURY|nr:GNAT family N-acetyltransferase [Natronococcus pandeyae]TYL39140.1 GNAT family N-acetyltransferase [Natronococcus pandeyae]